jgi:hypothetical protein
VGCLVVVGALAALDPSLQLPAILGDVAVEADVWVLLPGLHVEYVCTIQFVDVLALEVLGKVPVDDVVKSEDGIVHVTVPSMLVELNGRIEVKYLDAICPLVD